jgi:hypothetical protein
MVGVENEREVQEDWKVHDLSNAEMGKLQDAVVSNARWGTSIWTYELWDSLDL